MNNNKEKRLGNINGFTGGSYAGQVYDQNGLAPSLTSMQGGGRQPHIIIDDFYNERNLRVYDSYAPSLRAGRSGLKTIENIDEAKIVQKSGDRDKDGNYTVHNYSNCIPSNPMSDRGQMVVIPCASRGRNPEDPSDRTAGINTEQRLEVHDDGVSNCISTVSKDSLVLESRYKDLSKEELIDRYRIRKLTPLECWRLMGVSDNDFHKAQKVNSNTQLYKQAGNSIVVNVLVGIFGQLFDGKEEYYMQYAQ